MKCALAIALVLLLGAAPAAAQPFLIAEISGTFDREFESGATVPAGLGPGVSYTATIQYDISLAGPDAFTSPTEFRSDLDPATTQFVMEASGQVWSLPSSATLAPVLFVVHRIQTGTAIGDFELGASAQPDVVDFPGLFGPSSTATGQMVVDFEDPQPWNDTVLPASDHISDPAQIDLAGASTQLFRINANNRTSTWRFRRQPHDHPAHRAGSGDHRRRLVVEGQGPVRRVITAEFRDGRNPA